MNKIVIVCEEKLRKYGDFLAQLISIEDDTADEIIGIKDGSVAVQVWTEKEYLANAAQISSEQYILFIGNSKLIKDKRTHMNTRFSEFGMQYGWLGKQGVLYTTRVTSLEEYDNFIEYAKEHQPEISKLVEGKSKLIEAKATNEDSNKKETRRAKKLFSPIQYGLAALAYAPFGGVGLGMGLGVGLDKGLKALNNVTIYKKIEAQKYSYLTLTFYLHGLSEFLGLGDK